MTSTTIAAERPDHLVAAMPKYFPPIYSVSRNDVPTGYGVAFMELVAEHTELNIEYRSVANWPLAIQMVKEGEADIIPNFGVTPTRVDDFVYTRPFDEFELSIFVKEKTRTINSLNDLKKNRVGVVEFNRGESLMESVPAIDLVSYGSLGQLVAALNTDEVDAVVYPSVIFEDFTSTLGIAEKFKKVGQPLETIQRAIAVRKERSDLIPLLNRGIDAALASPAYPKIYERWHPGPSPYWTTRRVSMLIAGLIAAFVALWIAYRYMVLRKFNSVLVRYGNLNHAILNATSDGIITVDRNHYIVSMNAFAEKLFGASSLRLKGKPISHLLPGDEFHYLIDRVINDESVADHNTQLANIYSLETSAVRSDTDSFPVRVGLARMDADKEINVVCTVHDESRTYEAENRASQLLRHDPLTGLMNQRGMLEELSNIVRNSTDRIYCFCIGLTHMTQINILHGRQAGDDVLVRVGNALALTFNGDENVQFSRSSGSQFIMVVNKPVDTIEDIVESIVNALKCLEVSAAKTTDPLSIDFALGAAIFPDHAMSPIELINNAEIAYAKAKKYTHDNYSLYTSDVRAEQSEIETAYQRVKQALNEGRITLYFQPIQTIHSRKIHHYEALVRMFERDGTIIMPADIIPIAEQFNLITEIDYKVIGLVLNQLSLLKEEHPEIAISVNLSAKHIGEERLHELIKTEMSRHGIEFANLIFEITETAALQNFSAAREFMTDLRGFGCHFALDDFGVGFTSFAQLRTLPVDLIKIDGMFIKELHINKQDQVFVKAMTDVAHSLGKKVVAEYVENKEILDILRKYGVDFAQGYHIGRPDPEIFSASTPENNNKNKKRG